MDHSDITFNRMTASTEMIVDTLRSRGIVLIKNAIAPAIIDYCSVAMAQNSGELNAMIGKEVNYLPVCFTDRFLFDRTPPPYIDVKELEAFGDPLTRSGMDRSWYYEGKRQFKEWFWQNGSQMPNLLLHGLVNSSLRDVYLSYFGENCVSPYEHNALHYQRSDIERLSYFFHQDGSYFTRDPIDHIGLTTWVPLDPCGRDAPGLEVYPQKLNEVLGPPKGAVMPNMFADDQEVLARFGEDLWAPLFEVGDCLVFDNFSIHRSYITPNMTKQRQSADIRMFPASRLPDYVRLHGGWMMEI